VSRIREAACDCEASSAGEWMVMRMNGDCGTGWAGGGAGWIGHHYTARLVWFVSSVPDAARLP